MNVKEYIEKNLRKTVRVKGGLEGALDLPYRYTSPCAEGLFDDLYYWDTYFINIALLEEGLDELALNNILDFCYLIEKYGFIPNSANSGMLNRTQVPLFSLMCEEYLIKNPSLELEKKLFYYMEKEYNFWMTNRVLSNGLNAYKSHATKEFYEFFSKEYISRVNYKNDDKSLEEIGFCALAECESGWDFSLRFEGNCPYFAPVDLNSILYRTELVLAKFSSELGLERDYISKANKRKERMDELMLKDGLYYDYDSLNNKTSSYMNAAMFFPYALGVSSTSNTFSKLCDSLIYKHGLACGTKVEKSQILQWSYPNMWPNLVLMAFKACINLKEYEYASIIRNKFLDNVEEEFRSTNKLWEKYDVEDGGKSIHNEYCETEMMGWTAATYLYVRKECLKYGFRKE